jgi:hypothetical protein
MLNTVGGHHHNPNARLRQECYCSAECQRACWKEHKKTCKQSSGPTARAGATAGKAAFSVIDPSKMSREEIMAAPWFKNIRTAPGPPPTTAAAATTTTTAPPVGVKGGTCIICLEPDPLPIQSGCACRGDAGLAHVSCRIAAAKHKQKSTGVMIAWMQCGTCQRFFSGPMALGLAEECWRIESQDPAKGDAWVNAASFMASVCGTVNRYEIAHEHPTRLLVVSVLDCTHTHSLTHTHSHSHTHTHTHTHNHSHLHLTSASTHLHLPTHSPDHPRTHLLACASR